MTLSESVDKVLPVVADSWSRLRRSDVYRLLKQWEGDKSMIPRVGAIVIMNRSDLAEEVGECIEELMRE